MEYYVNYEIAKKLKEKGFSLNKEDVEFIGCRFIFSDECTIKRISTIGAYEKGYFGENIDCPTISQVFKWLREEKKINICIDIYDDGWFFDIASFYKEDTEVYEIEWPYISSNVTPHNDSYEQAAIAGIEYCLDNLI